MTDQNQHGEQTETKKLPPHSCKPEHAAKFRDWINTRGGLFVWESVDLSDPTFSMTSPATTDMGDLYEKPHWKLANTPARHITREDEVVVTAPREVKRFHVAVRMGGNGMALKVTDGGSRRIRAAVAKAGKGAWYEFDKFSQEAVIYQSDKDIPLNEWKEEEAPQQ